MRMSFYKPREVKLTRNQFEALIPGEWKEKKGGRFRQNGPFTTSIFKGLGGKKFKQVSDGVATIRGKTWTDLAEALELIKKGAKVHVSQELIQARLRQKIAREIEAKSS